MAKTNTRVNGKDYFRIQRVVGGKKKSFYGASKKEAEQKYIEYRESVERRYACEPLSDPQSDFCARAEEFIDNVLKPSQKYAHGTIARYISAYTSHIKDSDFAKLTAKDITPSDIQKFYNGLSVSMQTMRQIHKFMSAYYKWAVRMGYATDALSVVEIPRKESAHRSEDIVVWTDEEIEKIVSSLGDYRYRFFIFLLLLTGMRFSEALGLKYEDIKGGVIHIRRQCYLGEIKPPKANSQRDIPLHPVLKEEFKRHRAWHKKEMEQNGYETDFVFSTKSGNHIHRSSLDKSIRRFYRRNGITPKHNHAYRSTFCTQLCKSGVPIEVASKLLGHKNILVTAKHYALVEPQSAKDAIDALHFSFEKR